MDLLQVETIIACAERSALADWQPGDSYLAGGSWLFSEPQPAIRRLVDLTTFEWPALAITETGQGAGLEIAATCTISELAQAQAAGQLPAAWSAQALIPLCCNALLGSFKIWNVATVGGNVCLALPAAPMISLAAALDGTCTIWRSSGGERTVPVTELVTGAATTALQPGEVLRSISLPANALRARTSFRRYSLTNLGRSAVLVIGRVDLDSTAVFTVTAATTRPVQLRFSALPSAEELLTAFELAMTRGAAAYHDDVHGLPEWRADLTSRYLQEVQSELADSDGSRAQAE